MNKVFFLDQMQVAILLLLGVVILVGFFHKEEYFSSYSSVRARRW